MIICAFLPFISFKTEQEQVTILGLNIVTQKITTITGTPVGSQMQVFIPLLGIPLLLITIMTICVLIKAKKSTVYGLIISYIVSALSFVLTMLIAKKIVDAAQILPADFLVKNLGMGYWGLLILSFVGMVFAMKTVKMNPGYIVLTVLAVIWILPILWVIMISFRDEPGSYTSYFWPKKFTFKNYIVLMTDTSQFYFAKWFFNTLFVATCSCIISTIIVLSTSFTLSRLRFKGRKPFMNLALILGMFPSFMSMIAVYYILKGLGLTQSLFALIMVYSGGSALGYYIVKGFFDTIPKALDEAAIIDGATKWKVFTRITIPLSKPVIIYTMLISFISPWGDYIFARVIMGDKYDSYTVALGLYTMLDRANIATWYTRFAAGAVLVSIPISILFVSLQKYYVEGLSGSVKG
jgi:arabinogalactan oligomer/maltooligosaccharide transport system permease protein